MANPATRIGFIQFAFFAGLAAVVVRAAQLQIVQGRQWARVADSTRTASRELQPRRGTIYDRDGVPLAVSQEFYRVGVATWEVPERLRPKATRLLIRELKFEPAEVRAKFRRARQPRKRSFAVDVAGSRGPVADPLPLACDTAPFKARFTTNPPSRQAPA